MKKEKRILVAVSLLFVASVVFVFLNALDIKLGFAGGGCPDCLCGCNTANPGSVTPCGTVCPCGVCPAGTICNGTACVSCADLGSNCGTHFSSISGCMGVISCGDCSAKNTSCNYGTCNPNEKPTWSCNSGTCEYVCNADVACCGDTCISLGYECGTHTICGIAENCGDCSAKNTSCNYGTCNPNEKPTWSCNSGTCEYVCNADVACCTPSLDCTNYPGQCGTNLWNGCANVLDCSGACGGIQVCCVGNCQDPQCTGAGDCSDGDDCTSDICGTPGVCTGVCSNPDVGCISGDGCCPIGCVNPPDIDCCIPSLDCTNYPGQCGTNLSNGCEDILDCSGTCGGIKVCCTGNCQDPQCTGAGDCSDGNDCTNDICDNSGVCTGICSNPSVGCISGDGCCPAYCTRLSDFDCISNFTWLGRPIVDRVNDLILWILSIIGKIFLLIIILGGVSYIASGSNVEKQEKIKKVITSAIFGLIFVLLSYAFLGLLEKILVQ